MTYDDKILEAVAALDADCPGWHRKIDLGEFKLTDGHCVISQVYGIVGDGQIMQKVVEIGVGTLCTTFCPGPELDHDTRTPQWVALISSRQAADKFTHDTLSVDYPESEAVEGHEVLV